MAYTQADIDALDAEITKVRLVKATTMGDQLTTFRDLADLQVLRAQMVADVAATGSTRRTYRVAATSKGV